MQTGREDALPDRAADHNAAAEPAGGRSRRVQVRRDHLGQGARTILIPSNFIFAFFAFKCAFSEKIFLACFGNNIVRVL